MKILYGVQATGNGHISRSRVLAHYLSQHDNIEVTYLFSGRAKDGLFDMENFGDYQHRRGLTFANKNGRINYFNTLIQNNLFTFVRDIRNLNLEDYDLVISDFEPVTAWAAKLKSVPSIGIGHQYAFGPKTPVVGKYSLGRLIMKFFAPVKYRAGLHWYPFSEGILPPIIDSQMERAECDDRYVVYLPFENQTLVTGILNSLADYQFIQYSPELTDSESGNVSLRKTSLKGFKRDLSKAKGVICNAGFELISECLHLGLPILTKPLAGQVEQLSNALALDELGYADVQQKVTRQGIKEWLEKDKAIQPRPIPNVAEAIAQWVAAGEWESSKALMDELWQGIAIGLHDEQKE